MFGGIDTEKYVGNLTRINVLKDPRTGTFQHFTVALTSVAATSSSGSDGLSSSAFPIPVVLDSGTTLSYLPTDLAKQIWTEVGAIYLNNDGNNEINAAVIPCSRASEKGNFTFGFGGPGGPVIPVGMDELVLPLTDGNPPKFSSATKYKNQNMCGFGVQNFSSGPFLLGDSFLRSAYVVYDLVNNQVALAATDFNATKSNAVPFASSGAPIPSATVAPNQAQISGTGSGTSPGFAASSGFQSAGSLTPPAGWSGFAVAALSTVFIGIGSCLFAMF